VTLVAVELRFVGLGPPPRADSGARREDPGEFMRWLKLMMEVWVVLGVVSTIAGLIWTAQLSRETDPEISKAPPLPEHQLATASSYKPHSA
jgi:hypothetical protein